MPVTRAQIQISFSERPKPKNRWKIDTCDNEQKLIFDALYRCCNKRSQWIHWYGSRSPYPGRRLATVSMEIFNSAIYKPSNKVSSVKLQTHKFLTIEIWKMKSLIQIRHWQTDMHSTFTASRFIFPSMKAKTWSLIIWFRCNYTRIQI